jgi:hypothetical protein
MSTTDATLLWAQLRQVGLVEGEPPGAREAESPWFVRAMLGIAGWIGAMFLLGFVGAAFTIVMKSAFAGLVVGALLCAAATFIFRARPDGDFIGQFALAVGIAGQALIGVGLGRFFGSEVSLTALLFGATEVALFLLVPNFLHRVISAAAAAGALVIAFGVLGFHPYAQPIVFAAYAWAWLNEFRFPERSAQVRALGYGLTLLVIVDLAIGSGGEFWRSVGMGRGNTEVLGGACGYWIGAALVGTVAIRTVWKLLVRQGIAPTEGPGLAALCGAALVALISLKAPGLGVTVTIVLLGFANSNRVLTGFGILSLIAYWSYYYYSLEITLLQKSTLLFCAGVALLAARMVVVRRWPTGEGGEAGDA